MAKSTKTVVTENNSKTTEFKKPFEIGEYTYRQLTYALLDVCVKNGIKEFPMDIANVLENRIVTDENGNEKVVRGMRDVITRIGKYIPLEITSAKQYLNTENQKYRYSVTFKVGD